MRLKQCSEHTFRSEWGKLAAYLREDVELGVSGFQVPMYMGDEDWRDEWADWVKWSETATKVLKRKIHVNVRRDVREAYNKREVKVKEKILINKWRGVMQMYLKRPFSPGDKRVLLVGSEAEGDRELIWRPDEVKDYLRRFFEAWM